MGEMGIRTKLSATSVTIALATFTLAVTGITVHAIPANTVFTASRANNNSITIENSYGRPIAGADILIGDGLNGPFTNNRTHTNQHGSFAIPAQWNTSEPLTVTAAGYITTTFFNVAPKPAVFEINTVDSKNDIAIKGSTTGFQNPGQNGQMDFGLVYPALSRRQMAQFDVSSVISTRFDKIPVSFTSVSVPSNLTLPDQSQTYYFFPIEFDKPAYSMYVRQPGRYKMIAIHGQFPFSRVVGELRGGRSFYDVLNDFHFISGGERTVNATASGANGQNISVNNMIFDHSITVQAPQIPAGMAMVSLPLIEDHGVYYATDLKQVASQQTQNLAVPGGTDTKAVISLLMVKKQKQNVESPLSLNEQPELAVQVVINNLIGFVQMQEMDFLRSTSSPLSGQSIAFQSLTANRSISAQFMPLVAPPVMNSLDSLTLTPPEPVAGIMPVATYVVLSRIDLINAGRYRLAQRFRLYEGYSKGWVTNIHVPHVLNPLVPGQSYRWEVYFLGRETDGQQKHVMHKYFLDTVTHISRNSYSFKAQGSGSDAM